MFHGCDQIECAINFEIIVTVMNNFPFGSYILQIFEMLITFAIQGESGNLINLMQNCRKLIGSLILNLNEWHLKHVFISQINYYFTHN